MIEFIDSLTEKEQSRLYTFIHKFLEMKSNNLRVSESLSKHLEDGIFELKVDFENKTSRSLYFFEKEKMIIFTNGFIKKSQKTPKNEINKALKIRKYYLESKNEHS
jgi:phage-related protein